MNGCNVQMSHNVKGNLRITIILNSKLCNGFVVTTEVMLQVFRITVVMRPCIAEAQSGIGVHKFGKQHL